MRENGIIAEYVRKMRRKSNRSKGLKNRANNNYQDYVQRNYSKITEPLTVIYTDVTVHNFNGRKFYQSTMLDAATKQIIDYKISFRNDNKLVLDNLNATIVKLKEVKKNLSGIIIHSDHGYQYTSKAYKVWCESVGLIISMGKAYTCADNVVIESFHSLLKKGTIHNNVYRSFDEHYNSVIQWNNWYISRKPNLNFKFS